MSRPRYTWSDFIRDDPERGEIASETEQLGGPTGPADTGADGPATPSRSLADRLSSTLGQSPTPSSSSPDVNATGAASSSSMPKPKSKAPSRRRTRGRRRPRATAAEGSPSPFRRRLEVSFAPGASESDEALRRNKRRSIVASVRSSEEYLLCQRLLVEGRLRPNQLPPTPDASVESSKRRWEVEIKKWRDELRRLAEENSAG